MSATRTWADATGAAQKLGATEWRLARLLGLVPLLWPEPLGLLSALTVPTIYASLARLRQLGLVDSFQRTWRPGRNPSLYHLTDLGVAVIADAAGCEPVDFATTHHLRGRDLRAAIAGLPQLVNLYELLAELVRFLDGFEELLAWQPPSPRIVRSSTGRSSFTVSLPGYVRIGCSQGEVSWFLLVDRPDVPWDYWRLVLQGAARAGRRWGGDLPCWIIRTTHQARANYWDGLVDDAHISWSEPPLKGKIDYRPPSRLQTASKGIAREVDGNSVLPATASAPSQAQLAQAGDSTAELEPAELGMLDLLARHPFLTATEVAIFTESEDSEARAHLARLMKKGLVLKLERRASGCSGLYEASFTGLHLAAARLGLSLRAAVRFCHFAGGGAAQPIGAREGLAARLAHTHGVNATFAEFALTSLVTSRISGDGLLQWQSEGDASDPGFRPDGYGVYRLDAERFGFFLEYDRGTVHLDRYQQKLEAYYRYRQEGKWKRLYGGFPALLFVTTDDEAEARFAQAARTAAAGRVTPLAIWLTTEALVHARGNHLGVIGRIWRRPEGRPDDRRRWPPPLYSGAASRVAPA